jgi:hypothetical protein
VYEDDGTSYDYRQGAWSITNISCSREADVWMVRGVRHGQYRVGESSVTVQVHDESGVHAATTLSRGDWEIEVHLTHGGNVAARD